MLFATSSFEVVPKGRVILAKEGTHFSPCIPEGVEQGLNSRLFLLSVIPAKERFDFSHGKY